MALCADNTIYTGITKDVDRRIKEHNTSDKSAKYTRARRPVTLIGYWECESRSEALKKEIFIKKKSRKEKLEIIYEDFGYKVELFTERRYMS